MILVATPLLSASGSGAALREDVRLPPGAARPGGARRGGFVLRLAWVLVYGRVESARRGDQRHDLLRVHRREPRQRRGYTGPVEPTAGWPPGFPFLVSLLYRVFGERLSLALALNVVLSTATVVLIYLVVDRMLGRREARVAAGFFAILPGPLFMTGSLPLGDTFIFVLVGFLALMVFLPDRRWTAVRSAWRSGWPRSPGRGAADAVIPLAVWWGHTRPATWLARAALVLAVDGAHDRPWTIRNAIGMDAFIPVVEQRQLDALVGSQPVRQRRTR